MEVEEEVEKDQQIAGDTAEEVIMGFDHQTLAAAMASTSTSTSTSAEAEDVDSGRLQASTTSDVSGGGFEDWCVRENENTAGDRTPPSGYEMTGARQDGNGNVGREPPAQ